MAPQHASRRITVASTVGDVDDDARMNTLKSRDAFSRYLGSGEVDFFQSLETIEVLKPFVS